LSRDHDPHRGRPRPGRQGALSQIQICRSPGRLPVDRSATRKTFAQPRMVSAVAAPSTTSESRNSHHGSPPAAERSIPVMGAVKGMKVSARARVPEGSLRIGTRVQNGTTEVTMKMPLNCCEYL